MRRNAEGLLVSRGRPARPHLDGTRPHGRRSARLRRRGRRLRAHPRGLLQAAPPSRAHAVADIIHLIAELARELPPPTHPPRPRSASRAPRSSGASPSRLRTRGLGIPAYMIARLNADLSDPPPFNPAESAHLGLYVAARLAQRHGIGITLRDSPYGGTTADRPHPPRPHRLRRTGPPRPGPRYRPPRLRRQWPSRSRARPARGRVVRQARPPRDTPRGRQASRAAPPRRPQPSRHRRALMRAR